MNKDIDPVEYIDYYREHWTDFIEDVLHVNTWSGMRLIADSVRQNKRTSVRACHGISKTFVSASIAVTFLNLYFPSIVITTAPTEHQIKDLLWKEIGAFYKKSNGVLVGNAATMQVRVDPEWYMVGRAISEGAKIEGFHSPHILWVLDEAKGLPTWLYPAVEGSLTGGFARVLEISTTDGADQQCAFRQHHQQDRSGWNCIRLSAYDSPFVAPNKFPKEKRYMNQDLYAYGKPEHGREWDRKLEAKIQITNEEDIKDKRSLWEKKRPDMWETKVLGEFATEGENNIIPLDWVMAAVNSEVDDTTSNPCYGLDIARMGDDMCVLTPKTGKLVHMQETWGKTNTMKTCGIVMQQASKSEIVKVDACGMGVGVFDRLAELGQPCIGLDSSAKADDSEKFYNKRSELWWTSRELFERQYEEGNVLSIPDDPELIEDLTGLKYSVKSDGRIICEPKEAYKKRLGRSPDKGDSFVYAQYVYTPIVDQYIGDSDMMDIFL